MSFTPMSPAPASAGAAVACTVVVCGVSGTGKTTLGMALAARLRAAFLDADDFHPPENVAKMRAGRPLDDADRAPWVARLHAHLREHRQRGDTVVLACSALKASYRAALAGELPLVFWVFLNGDPALIATRMQARQAATSHYMPPTLLASQLAALEPPEGAINVPLELTTGAQVDHVLAAMSVVG